MLRRAHLAPGRPPEPALLAFGPALARGPVLVFPRPARLAIPRLGLSKLAHALAFGALLIIGFQR